MAAAVRYQSVVWTANPAARVRAASFHEHAPGSSGGSALLSGNSAPPCLADHTVVTKTRLALRNASRSPKICAIRRPLYWVYVGP